MGRAASVQRQLEERQGAHGEGAISAVPSRGAWGPRGTGRPRGLGKGFECQAGGGGAVSRERAAGGMGPEPREGAERGSLCPALARDPGALSSGRFAAHDLGP